MPETMPIRQAIRHKIASILLAGNTAAGSNVFRNRIRAIDPERLPCINIRTLHETARPLNMAPVSFARELVVAVTCIAAADDHVDDVLDALASQVESIIMGADVNGGYKDDDGEIFVNRVELTDTDLTLDIADQEFGAVAIAFTFFYDSRFDPNLSDLEGFNIKLKAAETTDILFQDNLDVEQDA